MTPVLIRSPSKIVPTNVNLTSVQPVLTQTKKKEKERKSKPARPLWVNYPRKTCRGKWQWILTYKYLPELKQYSAIEQLNVNLTISLSPDSSGCPATIWR